MRFLVSVIDDGQARDAGRVESATRDEAAAIDDFNDRLRAEGHWVLAAGVSAPEDATVIDNRGEIPVLSHGTVAEQASYVAGFWIIDVPDEGVALQIAGEGSKACNRRVEVRALL